MGKGIRSLLQNIDTDLKTTSGELKTAVVEAATSTFSAYPFDEIETNPKQPRHDFDEQALNELAAFHQTARYHSAYYRFKLTFWQIRLISGERS